MNVIRLLFGVMVALVSALPSLAQTVRTQTYLNGTAFAPGQTNSIGSDDFRDFVASVMGTQAINLRTGGSTVLPTGGDDTAAINAVLSAAKAAGKNVYAPSGVYKHANLINVDSVCLFGDGEQASIFQSTDTTTPEPNLAIKMLGTNPCLRNIGITSTWSGARQSASWTQGVWVSAASNYLIQNVRVTGGATGGFFQEGSNNGRVIGNMAINTLADAFGIYSGTHDVVEIGNHVINAGDDCFSIVDYSTDSPRISGIRIIGNECNGGSARGVAVIGGTGITVTGNTLVNTTASCLEAATDGGVGTFGPNDVVFSANTCDNAPNNTTSGYAGSAYVDGTTTFLATDITFANNVFRNVQVSCFAIGGGAAVSKNVSILGNTCDLAGATADNGVREAGVINLIVKDNTFFNVGHHGITHVSTVSPASSGLLQIEGNLFDKIATAGFGWAIFMPSAADKTFNMAVIRNNYLYRDGGTNAQGLITYAGSTNGVIDGNWGDLTNNNTITCTSPCRYVNP